MAKVTYNPNSPYGLPPKVTTSNTVTLGQAVPTSPNGPYLGGTAGNVAVGGGVVGTPNFPLYKEVMVPASREDEAFVERLKQAEKTIAEYRAHLQALYGDNLRLVEAKHQADADYADVLSIKDFLLNNAPDLYKEWESARRTAQEMLKE